MAEDQNTPQEVSDTAESDEQNPAEPETQPDASDAQSATEQDDSHDTRNDKHGLDPRDRKYRARLRDTEQKLADLTDQLATVQRQLVDGYVTRSGVLPEAFWASEPELATLVDETGALNTSKVDAAIAATRRRFGIPKAPKPNPAQGNEPVTADTAGWQNAFDHRRYR